MLQQKAKLKQQKAAPKRAQKTTMAAQKCAKEKKFQHFYRMKSIDVEYFKDQETLELTMFRKEASSGRRNER